MNNNSINTVYFLLSIVGWRDVVEFNSFISFISSIKLIEWKSERLLVYKVKLTILR